MDSKTKKYVGKEKEKELETCEVFHWTDRETGRTQASDGNETDNSVMSVSSTASTTSSMSTRKRRVRSQAASGGKQAKKAMFKGKEGEDEAEYLAVSNTRAKSNLPTVEDLVKEFQKKPTSELNASLNDWLRDVEHVAENSGNLQGNHALSLRTAVKKVRGFNQELVKRATKNPEIEQLQMENAELRSNIAALSAQLDGLQEQIHLQKVEYERLLTLKAASPTAPTRVPVLKLTRLGEADLAKQVAAKPTTVTPAKPGTSAAIRPAEAEEAAVVGSLAAPLAEAVEDREAALMERIAAMMDAKLAPLVAQIAHPKGEPSRGKKKGKGKASSRTPAPPPPVVSLPAVSAPRLGAPEVALPASTSSWTTVAKRKAKKPTGKAQPPCRPGVKLKVALVTRTARPKPARVPNSAAIAVTVTGKETTYASVMAAAKQRIKLSTCGIDSVQFKKSITGGVILEVSGPECGSKADTLAARMTESLSDLGVRIARPVKTGDFRVVDLDDGVTSEEVKEAVAATGGCSAEDVKVGEIRRSPSTLGTIWVRCPLAAVCKVVEGGRLLVGWTSAGVQVLRARPLQCYRCHEFGHVKATCRGGVDRSTLCYACGEPDHLAAQCTGPLRCSVCADLGRRANHRMGGKNCTQPKRKRVRVTLPSPIADKAKGDRACGTPSVEAMETEPPLLETMLVQEEEARRRDRGVCNGQPGPSAP